MIKVEHLVKRYDKQLVLDDISLSLPNRGLIYILGKSGCGKTTLINLLSSIDINYSGTIKIDDNEIKDMTEKEREEYRFFHVSYMFQDIYALQDETVFSNLRKIFNIQCCQNFEYEIDRILKRLGLEDKKYKKMKTLSIGERRRIAIARSILKESDYLFADEPTSSMNKNMRKAICDILKEESEKRCVIVITHDKDIIDKDGNVYTLKEGKLFQIRKSDERENDIQNLSKRRRYSLLNMIRDILSSFKSRMMLVTLCIATFALSLFTITFSFQLTGDISSSLKGSLLKNMEREDMLIKSKDESDFIESIDDISEDDIYDIDNTFKGMISPSKHIYLNSLDDFFDNKQQKITINYKNSSFIPKDISLDSFLNTTTYEECKDIDIHSKEKIEDDEIVIGLSLNELKTLYSLLKDSDTFYYEDDKEELLELIKEKNITLRLQAIRGDFSYSLDHSFRIIGFFKSEKNTLLVNDVSFEERFVKETLHFKERHISDNGEYPIWTLDYATGIRTYTGKRELFLKKFLEGEIYKRVDIQRKDCPLSNRYILFKSGSFKPSIYDINRYEDISSIRCSSSIYSYSISGYISGFNRPMFFSKQKEKLNQIEDENKYSSSDLGTLQFISLNVDDKVIKADILSSTTSNTITFQPIQGKEIYNGSLKEGSLDIVVSTGLINKLFYNDKDVIGSYIHVLGLDSTVQIGDKYENKFKSTELLITGIVQEEKMVIYQDKVFPVIFADSFLNTNRADYMIDEFVVRCSLDNHSEDYYIDKIESNGDYTASFPMKTMIDDIDSTLDKLSLLFLILSIISLLSAAFLISFSIYLIIKEEKKEMALSLVFGYKKKEIISFYTLEVFLISLISYILSLLISSFTKKVLSDTLSTILTETKSSYTPFLISFIICVIISSTISFFFALKLKKMKIKEILEKDN